MKKAFILAALAGMAASAQAAVVNVNLSDAAGKDTTHAQDLDGTAWSSAVAPLSYTGTTWNDTKYDYSDDGSGVFANSLRDSDGSPAGVGFSLTSWDSVAADWSGVPTLLKGGFWSSRQMTLTLSGLSPAATYDLFLGGNASNSHSSTFTIGTESRTTSATSNLGFIENDNYVHFSALTPDTNGNIVVLIDAGPKGVRIINGFQLANAVPEPTSLAVLGLAGMLVLRRKP